ncbi:hypothetical protein V8D89_002421 [Ganoderma adspersum]
MVFSPDAYVSPRPFIESGKATVPDLFKWHARENPSADVFRFHTGHGVQGLTYSDLDKGILRAARLVSSILGSHSHQRHVIAVFASADSITYPTILLGIYRAGHVAFPISPRNSPAAVADLVRKTKSAHVLVSQDTHITTVIQEAFAELDGVSQHTMPQFEDLYPAGASHDEGKIDDILDAPVYDPDSPALILHSSGSTNYPKPITWSHRSLLAWGTCQWNSPKSIGAVVGCHAVPMFHAMGCSAVIVTAVCGWVLCVFPPTSPPTVPNPENVFDGAVKTGAQYMYTVPSFIELWAQEPEKVAAMKKMKGLLFGGAPLNKGIGDMLATKGISLITAYGCTEIGGASTGIGAEPGLDWEYFSINHVLDTFMRPAGDGKYELLVLATSRCPPRVFNDSVNGVDAYATNDLFEPHPMKRGLWKVYGRVDDQIMLSNGEKTNPGPLEFIITKDPHVRGCLFFGRGKFQNGVLIEPTPEEQFDPRDERALEQFRNKIWPTIESANAIAPQHSRVFKEMILVTIPSKPLTYNMKGFPRRTPVLRDYEAEIESLYDVVVGQSAQASIPPPSTWNNADVKSFVQTAVQQTLRRTLPEDVDLFRNGCDSLQATYIRNTILRALRDHSPAAARRLPMNLVFQAPSVLALTDAVLRALSDYSHVEMAASTPEDLLRLVERYSANLPARPASLGARQAGKDVVLITGTMGGFGCDILEHLLRDKEIATVFAFNRKGTNAPERQRSRFRERGHDVGLLDLPKFRMVEADLQAADFGLERALLEEIRASVTHVMHNAWQVNFSLKVSSFEGDFLGVRHLLELALSSPYIEPPKLMFLSSIGVFSSESTLPDSPVSEDRVESASEIGTGYAESKWVVEEILLQVSENANLPTTTVRLGQVSGDRLGHWNEKEWFPAVVKSSLFTHCLPGDMNEASSVAFIPSYPAARAFVEMRKSTARTLHLVHPRPVPWKTIIAPIAEELGVLLVPYSEWLTGLEQCAAEGSAGEVDAMRANPALRLLDFFRAQGTACSEPGVRLSTTRAEQSSGELARMPELTPEDAKRWVAAWRASGFLPAAK